MCVHISRLREHVQYGRTNLLGIGLVRVVLHGRRHLFLGEYRRQVVVQLLPGLVVTGEYLRVRTAGGHHRVRRQVHRRLRPRHGHRRRGRYPRHVAVLALPQVNQSRVVGRVQRELPLQLVVQVAAVLGFRRLGGGLAPVVVRARRRRRGRRPRTATHPVRVIGVIVVCGRRRDVGHGPGQRLLLLVAAAGLLQRQANGLALDLSSGRTLPLRVFHQSLGDGLDGLQAALGVTELALVAVRALFAVRARLRADGGQTDAWRFAPEEHV